MTRITANPLEPGAFAPFGDVLDTRGGADKLINQGRCGRYHDRARLDPGPQGRIGISLFLSEPAALPYRLEMMERHPLGSQAFLPMTEHPWLVIVAPDADGDPGLPLAFLAGPGQGVNLLRDTWHAVLTPLHAPGRFAVVDRIGPGENLREHWFRTPFVITDQQDPRDP